MIPLTGKTKIYGVLGYPVSHTFSPPFQNSAFQATKINAVYLPFEVHPDQLGSAIQGIRSLNILGVNVTIPHKINVLPFLDEITPSAQKIGAVNTIRNDNGKLIGTNTDGLGFVRSLEKLLSIKGTTILILGAGGSTRSILVELAEAGAKHIFIANRTREKAQALVDEFASYYPQIEIEEKASKALHDQTIDLLVNTTNVGMKENESPIDLSKFQRINYVADIIYTPQQTALLEQANHLNIPSINGIGMLLYQGCEAFQFWTNIKAPVAVMEKQLLSILK